jgi:hypothetical protein
MPSRNELLAEHYLKVAGIAAVHVDIHGAIGTEQLVRIEIPPGRTSFCCNAGDEVRLARLAQLCGGDQAAIAAQVDELADAHGIGITPHHITVERALAAVQVVNNTIDGMQHNGGMRDLNRAFKVARKVDPSLRYHDYLQAKKAAMLEADGEGVRGASASADGTPGNQERSDWARTGEGLPSWESCLQKLEALLPIKGGACSAPDRQRA